MKGLGSDNSVARHVSEAVRRVEDMAIRAALRLPIEKGLPFALLADGSVTKTGRGGDGELSFVYHALLDKRICVDAIKLSKAPTAVELMVAARHSFMNYIINRHFAVFSSDHASVMRKRARDRCMAFAGDPPHALALQAW